MSGNSIGLHIISRVPFWGRLLVPVADVAVVGPVEALEGERGAESMATQALDAFPIVLVDGEVGVQREAGDEGERSDSWSSTVRETARTLRTDAACT